MNSPLKWLADIKLGIHMRSYTVVFLPSTPHTCTHPYCWCFHVICHVMPCFLYYQNRIGKGACRIPRPPAMGIYVLWCDCFILLWDIFWYVCRICEKFHFANTALHFQLVSPPEVGLLSWDTSGQYRYVGDSSGEFSMKFRAILADDWRKKSRVGEHRIIIVPKALKPMSPLLMQRSNSQFNAPCTYNRKLW